jgi:hypothetical protein
VLYSVLIAVGEELVPVICIVLFVALRQFDDIKNATPEIKFQLLKLKIELAASLVLDIVIKLVALLMFFSFLSVFSGECSDYTGFSLPFSLDLTGLFVLKKLSSSGSSSMSTVRKRVL